MESFIGALFVFLEGLIFLIIGILGIHKEDKFYNEGVKVTGKIIDYKVNSDNTWSYVCRFKTLKGDTIIGQERFYRRKSRNRSKRFGKMCSIVYFNSNPRNFEIYSFINLRFGFHILTLAGLVYMFIAIFIM